MNIKAIHKLFLNTNAVSTDTRNILPNSIFFALKGDNFNGNAFAQEALKKGATYAIIDEEAYQATNTILVKNVLQTLQELASFHRSYLNIPIIALTGSNGKTTTKELITHVLSQKYTVCATLGNLNNHIGVPLTLLGMNKKTEIGIVEMGANHLNEIDFLCKIAKPNYGYITNFGKAHLEGFGSIEGVIKGKTELYNYLIANKEHVFFNADDTIQISKLKNYKHKSGFSQKKDIHFCIGLKSANPFVTIQIDNATIQSNLIGSYNFNNLAAATLIGNYFKVPIVSIKKGIEAYVPTNNRSQIIKKQSNSIILDAYNANPTSMHAAVTNFYNLTAAKKIVILGDMFELGKHAATEHQNLVNYLENLNFNDVYLIGKNFFETKTNNKNMHCFTDFNSFKTSFNIPQHTNILIKGSRGMALERVLDLL